MRGTKSLLPLCSELLSLCVWFSSEGCVLNELRGGGAPVCLSVMATIGYQLDCIWNELQSRNGRHI